MTRFPSPGHLASWAGPCGRTSQSGARTRTGKGQGNAWLRGYLGRAAITAARSILIIVWHLPADPTARYHDLGPGHYQARTDKSRKARNHTRQLEALGYTVTTTRAA